MALVKVRFKNGTIKEISDHLAHNAALQKAQNFEVLDESGEPLPITEIQPQKKMESVAEVAVAEIVEPDQSEVEIVNPLIEASNEASNEPKNEPSDESKIIELHNLGKSVDEIKEATGINKNTIKSVIKKQ